MVKAMLLGYSLKIIIFKNSNKRILTVFVSNLLFVSRRMHTTALNSVANVKTCRGSKMFVYTESHQTL